MTLKNHCKIINTTRIYSFTLFLVQLKSSFISSRRKQLLSSSSNVHMWNGAPAEICNVSLTIMWTYFYSLAPIFVVSAKCIDSWDLEFVVYTKCIDSWDLEIVVSNTTGNNHWENCISLNFNFRGLIALRNQRKLESHD